MLVILGGHGGIYHATVLFACFLFVVFFCGDLMYQSIPSLTSPPRAKPGQFFDRQFPHHHPPGKRVQNPHPQAYKNELKPHHRGHFPKLFTMKT